MDKRSSGKEGFKVRISNVNDEFDAVQEAENFKWADVVVYHFPVWWFQVPNRLKFYIDEVFTAGHKMESMKVTDAPVPTRKLIMEPEV